jgi:hypothetical protein
MKQHFALRLFSFLLVLGLHACGIYSFTGASIQGKNIYIPTFENRARNVVPTLSATLTTKIRSRILSQTGLSPVSTDNADYDIVGDITAYDVTISGVQNGQQAAQNRLTITVKVTFKNRLDPKSNFEQSFSRFADFSAAQNLQSVENLLIETIGNDLADDIFNKAFVNW